MINWFLIGEGYKKFRWIFDVENFLLDRLLGCERLKKFFKVFRFKGKKDG